MPKHRVIYQVEEIRGNCPIYKEGDRIIVDSHENTEIINLEESDFVCLRVFDNAWNDLLYQAGSEETVAYLGTGVGECRIACPMPGEPYTPCGYVIFRVSREEIK